MWKRFFSLFLIIALLGGCVKQPSPMLTEIIPGKPLFQGQEFTRLVIKGRINLTLHTGYAKTQAIFQGDVRDLSQVRAFVKSKVLYLTMPKGYPRSGAVSADLQLSSLAMLNYQGAGLIQAPNIRSGFLDLIINNSGRTMLNGKLYLRKLRASGGGYLQINGVHSPYMQVYIQDKTKVEISGLINLSLLDVKGNGQVSLHWVKGLNLCIRGRDKAYIQLAGLVHRLEVSLWGASHFNGRYLRARRAYVKTYGTSIADITTLDHQHALASDASDIYFYHIPKTKADFFAFDGSILDLRDWDINNLHDYDRYNK